MNQVIEITIAADGGTKLETKGFVGQSCRTASKFLEEALGSRVGEELTAEFHKTQTTSNVDHRQS